MAPPNEIYGAPADGFVARFIGAGGVLPGRAEARGVRMGEVFLPAQAAARLQAGTEVDMFLRPEHVTLANADPGTPPGAGAVAAVVHEMTFFGSLTRIKLGLAQAAEGEIWADVPSDTAGRFTIGMPVWASWSPDSPRVLAR
jgi:ABC-type Fe3+/spermidine/putrescine transport system ATPase subunit